MIDKMTFTELYSLLKCVEYLRKKFDNNQIINNNSNYDEYCLKRKKLNEIHDRITNNIELKINEL